MSQTRYHNYQRPVDSFQENRRFAGLIAPGRYRGFDGLANIVGLNADVGHTSTGYSFIASNNSTVSNKSGIWVTTQGSIIQEDAAIALSFSSNAGNSFERIDAIYGEHQWLGSAGGQAAIYGVIQGANGGPVKPSVSNPKIQVILGYVHIPANASTLASATFEAALVPNIANADIILNHPELDARYARLDAVDRYLLCRNGIKHLLTGLYLWHMNGLLTTMVTSLILPE